MIGIQDFVSYMKKINTNITVYPLIFPSSNTVKGQSMTVNIGNGFKNRGNIFEIVLSIAVRDTHPSKAEQLAKEINSYLSNRTNDKVGDYQIVIIRSQQLIPMYRGKDSNDYHYYMLDFKMLLTNNNI